MKRLHRPIAAALGLMLLCGPVLARDDGFGRTFTVDLTRYDGLWYEYARTPNFFEDNEPRYRGKQFSACTNATAEYRELEPGRIEVVNTCERRAEEDGEVMRESANGIALVKEGSGNRKLAVAFGGGFARFMQRLFTWGGGDYWIFCLGPLEGADDYQWAVISGASRRYSFILSRTPEVSDARRAQMLDCAREEGIPVEKLIFMQDR